MADSANGRRRLPDERPAVTRRFVVGGCKGYVTVGLYDDGTPGEIFVRVAKTGGTLSGLLDGWAITTSLALQHGVPLRAICDKLAYTRFDPCGWSGDSEIGYATSILDWIARWLAKRFLGHDPPRQNPVVVTVPPPPSSSSSRPQPVVEEPVSLGQLPLSTGGRQSSAPLEQPPKQGGNLAAPVVFGDGPPCRRCGCIMVRMGAGDCWACPSCAETEGSCGG